jgi:hypothetical protein
MVSGPVVEDDASAIPTSVLALDSEKYVRTQMNHEVIRLALSGRHQHFKASLYECVQDR